MHQTPLIKPGSIGELAKKLLLARADDGDDVNPRGRAVFWIGAGASVSAGIPSGRALAGRLAVRLARKLGLFASSMIDEDDESNHHFAFTALQKAGEIDGSSSLGSAYGELFARLDANQQRDFVRRVILRTNRRQINWTHLALGELVRERIAHTLLTTNFDDLLLDGLVRCDQLPAIIDGVESLNRLDPRPPVPQLVYLHGSQHTYSPRNSTEAVLGTRDLAQARGGLFGLLQQCSVLTIVGYAGNVGEGVMEMLLSVSRSLPDLPLYWIAHGQQDSLSPLAIELLSQGAHARLIAGQDADLFFRALLRQTKIGVPAWFRDPVDHLLRLAERICVERRAECAELGDEVDEFCERLRSLQPVWAAVGEANRERREVRQLLLADDHEAIWFRLGERTLDDLVLLQMRAESAYEIGRRGRPELLRQAVRDGSAVLRRLSPGTPEWALAQVRLGDALAVLGERGDPRAVRDAIAAYDAALAVRTRDTMPASWSATRNNQGLAWLTLGEWGDDDALEQALVAFRDALEVCTPASAPTEWAATQCNLGNALQILGRTRSDVDRLAQAVHAYDEALLVHARDARDGDWAMTSCDRASALIALGQLGSDPALAEAVRTLDDVAGALTREASPVLWARLRKNLGVALLAQGQRGDEAALRRGIDVLRDALAWHAGRAAPAAWSVASLDLGAALLELGRQGNAAALSEALGTLADATQLLDGEVYPPDQRLNIGALAQRVLDELTRVVAREAAPVPGMKGEGTAAALARGGGTRVLVIEDDLVQQNLIDLRLRACMTGVEPTYCGDGRTGLAVLDECPPDLVILDLGLPDMDGRDVLRRIREQRPSLPVLVYSGDADSLSDLRAHTSRALAVLDKDAGLEAFTRLVPTLFKRRNGDRASRAVRTNERTAH